MSEHHDLCPCVDPDAINPTCDCVALDAAGVKRGRALGRVVVAEDVQASDERGAWTCGACGFRGFWRGGPHCAIGVKAPAPFEEWLDGWLRAHPEARTYDKEAMRDAFAAGRAYGVPASDGSKPE